MIVAVHKLPNIMLAKWDDRNMARVVFPGLFERGGSSNLSEEHQREFYEKGLLPAMELLDPHYASEWNPTYDAEKSRARRFNGTYSYQTKVISGLDVRRLGQCLRESLVQNGVQWADGFFFLLNVRGTKSGYGHTMSAEGAAGSLNVYLDSLGLKDVYRASRDPVFAATKGLQDDTWLIDVGLDFSARTTPEDVGLPMPEEPCLLWRTDRHAHVMQEILGINMATATRITTPTSGGYSRDITSHLPAVSGCRIELGVTSQGLYDAVYAQLYVTCKALTYGPEGKHHGKAMTFANAMSPNNPFLTDRYNQYKKASMRNSSHARVEVRVPLCHALTVLLEADVDIIRRSLLSIPRRTWWYVYRFLILSIPY